MKLIPSKTAQFRDIQSSQISVGMLKDASHENEKLVLTLRPFARTELENSRDMQYILFYYSDETARDDYRLLLKFFKKQHGK